MSTEWTGIEELAAELGVPVRTIYAWRTKKLGPPGYKLGKHIRFRREDVEAWLEQHAETGAGAA
jgi:excisionase family DNA binding protein